MLVPNNKQKRLRKRSQARGNYQQRHAGNCTGGGVAGAKMGVRGRWEARKARW